MCRNISSGKRELLSATRWTESLIWFDSAHVYYVWKPDFDQLDLGSAQADDASDLKEPLQPIDRAKAVLCDLYPPDGKPPRKLSLAAVGRAVWDKCEEWGWKPPSEDTVGRALEELGHRPPRKRK
jgi:hypothetical protein